MPKTCVELIAQYEDCEDCTESCGWNPCKAHQHLDAHHRDTDRIMLECANRITHFEDHRPGKCQHHKDEDLAKLNKSDDASEAMHCLLVSGGCVCLLQWDHDQFLHHSTVLGCMCAKADVVPCGIFWDYLYLSLSWCRRASLADILQWQTWMHNPVRADLVLVLVVTQPLCHMICIILVYDFRCIEAFKSIDRACVCLLMIEFYEWEC